MPDTAEHREAQMKAQLKLLISEIITDVIEKWNSLNERTNSQFMALDESQADIREHLKLLECGAQD